MEISLTAKEADAAKAVNAQPLLKKLEQTNGVKKVQATGNNTNGYLITIDNQKLLANGLNYQQVKDALTLQGSSNPNGVVTLNNLQLRLDVKASDLNKESLENTMVETQNGKNVLLMDIAKIQKSTIQTDTIARTNGHSSVLIDLYKTPSADVTIVSQEVMKAINNFKSANSKMDTTILSNQGQMVSDAMNGLWKEGLLGCLFSMLCVFLFFRDWRSTAVTVITLPICFLTAVSVLKSMGMTLNLLTASGLIVAMGRVVDDSIVLLDNMYRKLEKNRRFSLPVLAAAVKEMVPAVVSSTLTTIAVYLPLTFTQNMVGHAFFGFAWTVTIALLCSLAVSIIILPPYVAFTWRQRFAQTAPPIEHWVNPLLKQVFQKRKLFFFTSCILLFASIAGALFIPVHIFPRTHANDLNIQIECPENAPLEEVNAEVRSLEILLHKHKEIETYSSMIGSSFTPAFDDVFDQGGGWIQQRNIANIYVKPRGDIDTDQLVKKIHADISVLSSAATYTVTKQQISGDDSRVRLTLSGGTSDDLIKAANLLKAKLQLINGLQIYGDGETGTQQQFSIKLDEKKINALGLDRTAILTRIESFMDKQETLHLNGNDGEIVVQLHKPSNVVLSYKQGNDPIQAILLQLGRLTFKDMNGHLVPLNQLAKLNVTLNAPFSEKNGEPIAILTGNILTDQISGTTGQIKETIQKLNLPKGIKVEFGGIPQQVQQMIWSISFAGILSILLVMVIVTTIFKGFRSPVAVLSSLPFALIGSVSFLLIFRQSWNLGALAGLIMLIGIVSTNGIVLVDRLERIRTTNKALSQVILEGTASRVRPILMTAFATILTLLPLTFAAQNSTLISQSLGLVVVGGMITSTLTCIFITPTVYYWLWKPAGSKNKINSIKTANLSLKTGTNLEK